MLCPRLDHFVRLETNGKIGKCGNMVNAQRFDSVNELQKSEWLEKIKKQMANNQWPEECIRCKSTEEINNRSIRLDMLERDKILKPIREDYLIVGGTLDNICNSACQTCNETLSSKIGSLKNNHVKVNNLEMFYRLPQERVIELDINGGEPTYSPNYKKILQSPPTNVRIIRINTNGHRVFNELIPLLEKGLRVIITISFDGLDKIHDYTRWPIKFKNVNNTIGSYRQIQKRYPKLLRINLWTTVSVYNINQFDDIVKFAVENNVDHSYGILENPQVLSIAQINKLTLDAKSKYINSKDDTLRRLSKKIATMNNNSAELLDYITKQDMFRSINFKDYFNFDPNLL